MNFNKIVLTLIIMSCFSVCMIQAQSVGINTTSPDTTAALDVVSTTKGMLVPRMNTGQRTGIANAAIGLLVFDTDSESFWYHQSNGWVELTNGAFTNDGGVVRSTGNHSTDDFVFGAESLPPATSISDTLIFFDKSKGALRSGLLLNTKVWAPDSIGDYSFSTGYNNVASGLLSIAHGYNTRSTNLASIALGQYTKATAQSAMATGFHSRASNFASSAFGRYTQANGSASFAIGNYVNADAYSSFALGQYNVGGGSNNDWISSDPVFEIGIGDGDMDRKNAMTVLKNGDFIVGSENVAPATPITETLMFFDKSKSAFRAGRLVNSNLWAPDSIGFYSIAFGYNTLAKGIYSFATGRSTMANSFNSTAMGSFTIANGYNSTAMGTYTQANAEASTSMGNNTKANGSNSTAMGNNSTANGSSSTAMGWYTVANGYASTAMGILTQANGEYSTATGEWTTAVAKSSMAIGRWNVGAGDSINWISTDPIFEIGNGSGSSSRNNAMTVLKNGDFILGREDVPPATPITDTLMFFDKSKGAFRFGKLANSNAWAPDSIGNYSFSSGYNTVATGNYAVVHGFETSASGNGSFALGQQTLASGGGSVATGVITKASGLGSFATGSGSIASGAFCIATGWNTLASNYATCTSGFETEANGYASFATGHGNKADAFGSFALGRYNVGGGSNNDWIPTDPIFEVGIGTTSENRENAVTILKNGDFIVGRENVPPVTAITDKLLLFDHSKAAFRSGNLSSSNAWAQDSIGNYSFATGQNTKATATYSFSSGIGSIASGEVSFAAGQNTIASNTFAFASGFETEANGLASFASGSQVKADALASFAVGQSNVGGGSNSNWISTDPIFEVGIGTNGGHKNAMTILKNGNVGIGTATPTAPIEVTSNSNSTIPQLKLTESAANDGTRIIFNNSVETDNRWTLFGLADNTHANSVFNIFYNNIGNIITANGLGNVGIKCNPDADLHIRHSNSGGSGGMKLQNSTNDEFARLYVSSSDGNLRIYFDTTGLKGTFNDVNGVYSTVSDRRLKYNFQELDFDWNSFSRLVPLTYTYNNDDEAKRYIGMVAQDVLEIYPQLITYVEEEDRYTMDYSGFGVIAVKAIQEQQKIIDQQAQVILRQEERLLKVEAMLESLLEKQK